MYTLFLVENPKISIYLSQLTVNKFYWFCEEELEDIIKKIEFEVDTLWKPQPTNDASICWLNWPCLLYNSLEIFSSIGRELISKHVLCPWFGDVFIGKLNYANFAVFLSSWKDYKRSNKTDKHRPNIYMQAKFLKAIYFNLFVWNKIQNPN